MANIAADPFVLGDREISIAFNIGEGKVAA
jgi:hypothetical protein